MQRISLEKGFCLEGFCLGGVLRGGLSRPWNVLNSALLHPVQIFKIRKSRAGPNGVMLVGTAEDVVNAQLSAEV